MSALPFALASAAPTITLVTGVGDSISNNFYLLKAAGPAALDTAGDVAILGSLAGWKVVKGADAAILLYTSMECIPIANLGEKDPSTGGIFTKLSDPVMSASGAVAFIGSLKIAGLITKANNTGVYVYKNDGLSLVARAGKPAPTGTAFSVPVTYGTFDEIAINNAGGVAFTGEVVGQGIKAPAFFAADESGALHMLFADFKSSVPNPLLVQSLNAFGPLTFVQGQSRSFDSVGGNAALIGEIDPLFKGNITLALSGVSGFTTSTVAQLGETGGSLGTATIKSLGEPVVNSKSTVAFLAGVTGGDNKDLICLVSGSNLSDVTPTGQIFTKLSDPVLNNHDHVAFLGTTKAGANPSTTGIWSDWDGTMKQVVKAGDTAPGGFGGKFAAFTQIVLPDVGGPIFLATLSGVPKSQSTGLWAIASDETLTPIVVTGDTTNTLDFHGVAETVKSLSIFQTAPGVRGVSRSFDASTGNLVFKAGFTDGLWGMYKFTQQ